MKYLVSLFFILMTNIALACTPGTGNGPTGDPNCMAGVLANQPQGNSGGGRTITRITYYDNWGAIVTNLNNDKTARQLYFANRYPTEESAINAALKKCGAKTCKVEGTYANGYLVLTTSQTSDGMWIMGMGVNEDISIAQTRSFANCKKKGGINCYIVDIQDSR